MKSFFVKKIKIIFFLQIFVWICVGFLLPQSDLGNFKKNESKTIIVENIFPSSFIGTKPNVIQDSTHCLNSFFEKLSMLGNSADTVQNVVRIVQIGDSHIRSHEFTPAMNARLIENFGNAAANCFSGYKSEGILEENGSSGVICHCIGINGATSENFLNVQYLNAIQQLKPDLIIVSLGTNEAFGKYYSFTNHNQMMEILFSALKNFCPDVPVLYTTPPGAYKTTYRTFRKYKRTYSTVASVKENENIKRSAFAIKQFAATHNQACWDMFNIVGGERYACRNWLNSDYFRKDKVHFTAAGYAFQGNLLYQALMKAYNDYILSKNE
ncbi:MAG: GDSL-type esterase/lipase family protein [Paludibacter sp.]|nr:GDSL-type esterase/lipase family protein [Paludibacter sp.]